MARLDVPKRDQWTAAFKDQRLVLAMEDLFRRAVDDFLRTGDLVWHTETARDGALRANGQAVSRTTYADLFAVIGTDYGVGDGSTTFNVPNASNNLGGVTNFAYIVY